METPEHLYHQIAAQTDPIDAAACALHPTFRVVVNAAYHAGRADHHEVERQHETPPPALPDPAAEPMIDAGRVATLTKMSIRGVLYAAERGDLPSVRVGRRVLFPTARILTRLGLHEPKNE